MIRTLARHGSHAFSFTECPSIGTNRPQAELNVATYQVVVAETSAESRTITKFDQETINGFLQPSFKKKGEVTNRPSKLKFTSPWCAKYGQPSMADRTC